MRLIVLAAGKGTRLRPITNGCPKILVELSAGTTLLSRQIEEIAKSNVFEELVYVVGYMADRVEQAIEALRKRHGLKIRTVFNPFFDVSNNLASLWLARNEIAGDVMVTNGDNLFLSSVYAEMAQTDANSMSLAVGSKSSFDEDDMKVSIGPDDLLLAVDKTLPLEECNAESLGLMRIAGQEQCDTFSVALGALMRRPEYLNCYWLKAINHLITQLAVPVKTRYFETDREWQEVDFAEDVKEATRIFCSE